MALAEKVMQLREHLHFGKLTEKEHKARTWRAEVPSGTTLNAVMIPSYWAHYTKLIRPGDDIDVTCEDASWRALLWVMFVGTAEIKTELFYSKDFTTAEPADTSDIYAIVWKGPVMKWAIVNKQGGAIIKDHLFPKSEAANYLRQHLNIMKA